MTTRDIPGVPRQGKRHALPKPRNPIIVEQPNTYLNILQGTDLIVDAIRPTLGPLPRLVVMEALRRTDLPEFLDDGATIARRIIEIEPRGVDVGAMLVRRALWQMREEAGDGSTTMAVIYQSLLREGIRHVTTFERNAMLLRGGLEKGLKIIQASLQAEAMPLEGRENIAAIARGMCQGDDALADILGEIFDIVGPDGLIVIEGYQKLGLEREYIEGTYWKLSGWFSRLFVTEKPDKRTVFEDAAVLITDFDINDPHLLVPPLERCVKAGIKKLVIIARAISDAAIGLLVSNNKSGAIETLVVRVPKTQEMDRVASIEDIAILTGGKPIYSAAFGTLDEFRVEDLGHARRAWATESMFGIYGGKGDPRKIRQRMSVVRGLLQSADLESTRRDLQSRLGHLHGGTVILRLGGIHEIQRETRKTVAERAVTTLRNAILGGVIPGGGVALINAQHALAHAAPENEHAAAAYQMLARALEEPLRAIVSNAGYKPDVIVDKVQALPPGHGFDARSGKLVDMREAGILDPALVIAKALDIAVSGAAMALTTDVVIHHRKPVESIEP